MFAIGRLAFSTVLLLASVAANADLVAVDGGALVMDTTANLTWVSDASLFQTQATAYSGGEAAFVQLVINTSGGSVIGSDGVHALSPTLDFFLIDGGLSRWGAQAWMNYLNATSYQGYSDWRLPTTVNDASSQFFPPALSSSEMANLFYGQLGQVTGPGIVEANNGSGGYGLFSDLQDALYWSGTPYTLEPYTTLSEQSWGFDTNAGSQADWSDGTDGRALIVRTPEPTTLSLLGLGLAGIGLMRRRKTH